MTAQAARAMVEDVFREALHVVEPGAAVRRVLSAEDDAILVDGHQIPAPSKGVSVVAIGKAAGAMARAAADVLNGTVATGYILTKDGHSGKVPPGFVAYEASHPIPDARGVKATREILAHLTRLARGDVIVALISGGGSALLESPRPPLDLAALQSTTDLLLRAGAPIQDLNVVRTVLSEVKGGGLRRAMSHATCVSLILSDVLGNDPTAIASGPTVQGERDAGKARQVLERYGVFDRAPAAVQEMVTNASPDVNDLSGYQTDGDVYQIIGDNELLIAAVDTEFATRGLRVRRAHPAAEGEARRLAVDFTSLCLSQADDIDVVLGGGEATVRVTGDGVGGRNTEFALAAAVDLARTGSSWVIASLASDGQDGGVDAAGAIVDGGTVTRADGVIQALATNDSGRFLGATGSLVVTGPTGTNVNDVYVGVRLRDN